MRVTGRFQLFAFGALSASAADWGSRKSLLSSDYAASTTTIAPRQVPDRLYKPMDSFGSQVDLHAEDDKSKDGGTAKASENVEVKSAAGDKAKVEKSEDAGKVEEAEKAEKSESEEAEKAEEAKAKEAETDEEAKKTEEAKAKEVEPAGTPAPADTVPPAPAPKLAVGPEREFDHAAYEEDWHSEWSHGDYPSYKETHAEAEKIEQYEDRQSDGKASAPGGKYAKKEKKETSK